MQIKFNLRNILTLLLTFFAALNFTACEDDDGAKTYEKPTITSLSIDQGFVGDEVTITGTGLKKVSKVQFADEDAAGFNASANTDTEITVQVPEGVDAGLVEVSVYYDSPNENNLGASDNASFTVLVAPVISEIEPASAKPTKQITIKGNYLETATAVRFGTQSVDFQILGKTVVVTVPDLAPQQIEVTVETPGGSASKMFQVLGKSPEVTSFSPVEGKPGTTVTVNGIFFENITGVKIGNVAASTFTVVSPTELTFKVPAGSTPNVITVTNSFGSGSSTDSYNVIQTLSLPYTVYSESLNADWALWGWGNTTTLTSTDQASGGTKSAKVAYNDNWGGFQLHPNNPNPFDIGSVTKVKVSIYGGANSGGKQVQMYIKPKSGGTPPTKALTLVAGQWTTFEIPLSDLGSPADIDELVIQNMGNASLEMYVDDLILL